jgi:hypothetical protein
MDEKYYKLRIVEIINKNVDDQPNPCYKNKDIIEYGNALNKLGGYNSMLEVATFVSIECGPIRARELEFAWSGIGDWQA